MVMSLCWLIDIVMEDIFMISRTGQPTTRKQKPMIVNQSFFDSLKVCTEKIKKVNIN